MAEAQPRRVSTLGPPAAALAVGLTFIWVRFGFLSGRFPVVSTFSRHDSGQYLSIARRGYWDRTTHCIASHHQHPRLCGNVTWFPGYPALMRLVSFATNDSLQWAALIVGWAGWYVVLVQIWRLSAGRGRLRQWLCLGLGLFFPGQVYFATIFPLSLAVGAALVCVEAAVRGKLRLALPMGFAAGASYLALVLIAPALLIGALLGRARRTMVLAALSVVAGLGAVLLYAQLTVHLWNAYFVTEKGEYGVGLHGPWANLVTHLHPLWGKGPSHASTDTAVQSVLVMTLLAVGSVVTVAGWVRERSLPALDAVLLTAAGAMWLLPYLAGGALSVYRAEGCVILVVPLLRRAPAWLLLPLGVVAAVVAYLMAKWFYRNILV